MRRTRPISRYQALRTPATLQRFHRTPFSSSYRRGGRGSLNFRNPLGSNPFPTYGRRNVYADRTPHVKPHNKIQLGYNDRVQLERDHNRDRERMESRRERSRSRSREREKNRKSRVDKSQRRDNSKTESSEEDDWWQKGAAEELMNVIECNVCAEAKHKYDINVVLSEEHRNLLRERFKTEGTGFWTILDQLREALVTTAWNRVSDTSVYISAIIAQLQPIHTRIRAAELIMILLIKMWPGYNPSIPSLPELDLERDSKIPEEVPSLSSVYSLDTVMRCLDRIEEHLHRTTGRRIHFEETHKDFIRSSFAKDQFGIWSKLDQLQEHMSQAEWAKILKPRNYIMSLLSNARVIDAPLSATFSSILPKHPSVPPRLPPHVVALKTSLPYVSSFPKEDTGQTSVITAPSVIEPGDFNGPFSWKDVTLILEETSQMMYRRHHFEIRFEESHLQVLKIMWKQDYLRFIGILDQLIQLLLKREWRAENKTLPVAAISSLVPHFERGRDGRISTNLVSFLLPLLPSTAVAALDQSTLA